jgi:hypothetical protein
MIVQRPTGFAPAATLAGGHAVVHAGRVSRSGNTSPAGYGLIRPAFTVVLTFVQNDELVGSPAFPLRRFFCGHRYNVRPEASANTGPSSSVGSIRIPAGSGCVTNPCPPGRTKVGLHAATSNARIAGALASHRMRMTPPRSTTGSLPSVVCVRPFSRRAHLWPAHVCSRVDSLAGWTRLIHDTPYTRISPRSDEVRLLPVPQAFASTPMTLMAVYPRRVAGVPPPSMCSPLLIRPPARPAVKAGMPSSE